MEFTDEKLETIKAALDMGKPLKEIAASEGIEVGGGRIGSLYKALRAKYAGVTDLIRANNPSQNRKDLTLEQVEKRIDNLNKQLAKAHDTRQAILDAQ